MPADAITPQPAPADAARGAIGLDMTVQPIYVPYLVIVTVAALPLPVTAIVPLLTQRHDTVQRAQLLTVPGP